MNIVFATSLYELQSTGAVSETVVEHEGLEEFCSRLQHLLQATSDMKDDSWASPLRKLRHYRFDQCAGPIGFGHSDVMSEEKLKAIEEELSLCSLSYEHLKTSVSDLIDCLKNLAHSNENPLFDEIKNHIIEGRKTGILLKEARHIAMLNEIKKDCSLSDSLQVVSQQQLSKIEKTFDLLLCIGRSEWFSEFVFRAPRARETRIVRYSWLSDSDCRKNHHFKGWTDLRSKLEKHNKIRPRKASTTQIGSTVSNKPRDWNLPDDKLIPRFDLIVNAKRFESNNKDTSNNIREDVAARLVELEGERGTFVEAESNGVLVVDLDENNQGNVDKVPVGSILPGMFLLLRGDADSDAEYIIPVADLILGKKAEQLRRFQQGWKTNLKNIVNTEGLKNTVEKLKEAGSKRASEINLRNWLWHRNIRTDDPEDFFAIMRVIGMGDIETKCWGYAKQIDSAHRKAGRGIRKELLRQVHEADMNELEQLGEMRFELEGIGGRPMLAVRIIRVSDFTSNVSPQNLNRLFELEENLNG